MDGTMAMVMRMGREEEEQKQPHAVVISFPAQSHVTPMMQLSKLLAIHGFRISFLLSQNLHHLILQPQPDDAGPPLPHHLASRITLHPIPDGFPSPYVGDPAHIPLLLQCVHSTFRHNVHDWLRRLPSLHDNTMPALTCLIGHHALWWIHDLGHQFHIPVAAFWTTSAAAYAVQAHIPSLQKTGIFPFTGKDDRFVCCIPGVLPLKPHDFPSFLQIWKNEMDEASDEKSDYLYFYFQQLMHSFLRLREARWIFANTFYELERETIDTINSIILDGATIFSAIGPLYPSALPCEERQDNRAGTSLLPEADCLAWLDKQKPSSVIYIAFGSLLKHSAAQLEELAMGLWASEQPFLWVTRHGVLAEEQNDDCSPQTQTLPKSFLEATEHQGLVVPWVSQSLVLSHPSVGGFLSHCGWNSCIESISLGVPVLAFPEFAEQKLNARYIVDVWKVGMELGGGEGTVGREEVEKMIRRLMGEIGREVRESAEKWKEKAMEPLSWGSSHKNILKFVEEMKATANEAHI